MIPVGSSNLASAKAYGTLASSEGGTVGTNTTQTSALVDDRELYGSVDEADVKGGSRSEVDDDLEMQQLEHGVGVSDVSRTYSVRSG